MNDRDDNRTIREADENLEDESVNKTARTRHSEDQDYDKKRKLTNKMYQIINDKVERVSAEVFARMQPINLPSRLWDRSKIEQDLMFKVLNNLILA